MLSAGTSVFAAAMTCSRRALRPTSCSTLGRLLLSRVPLPAAMMATANPVASMGLIFSCDEVQVSDATEAGECGLDLGLVANDYDDEFGDDDVLIRDAGYVGAGDSLDAALVLFEEIRRIAVERQRDLLVERLLRRVVVEDERVHHLIFGLLQLRGSGRLGLEPANLIQHGLCGGDSTDTLGACFAEEYTGMVIRGSEGAADVICEAEASTHRLHDTRTEAAGEYLVHDAERVVVGIAALGAEADDLHVGLVHVFLVDEVNAGLRSGEFALERVDLGPVRKRLEDLAQLGFHFRGVEVAADGDDDVAGRDGAVVPLLQVVEGDGVDGGVFSLASVWAAGAVDDLGRFAARDRSCVV